MCLYENSYSMRNNYHDIKLFNKKNLLSTDIAKYLSIDWKRNKFSHKNCHDVIVNLNDMVKKKMSAV